MAQYGQFADAPNEIQLARGVSPNRRKFLQSFANWIFQSKSRLFL